MLQKQSQYIGEKEWNKNDILNIPFIKISDAINYDELCGRMIKGTENYIRQAFQTVDFELNNYDYHDLKFFLLLKQQCHQRP